MQTDQESKTSSGSRKILAALVVMVLVLGSGVVYFAEAATTSGSSSSATIRNLQSSVSSLENTNNQLQAQLAALSTTSAATGNISAAQSINAEQIYASANASVLTIQGVKLVSTTGLIGGASAAETI